MPDHQRGLRLFLRAFGIVELLALVGLLMPRSWMVQTYEALELGQVPARPMFFFLARLASLMYAVHAVIVLFVSFDVNRYARVITLIGGLMVLQGVAVLAGGLYEEIPLWWSAGDGAAVAVFGLLMLVLQYQASKAGAH